MKRVILPSKPVERVSNIVGKSIRSLAKNEKITVTFSSAYHQSPAPAWTDGVNIYVDSELAEEASELVTKGCTPEELAPYVLRIKGLLYHEAAHCIYSPRMYEPEHQRIIHNGLQRAFNILEDQRIERLLVSKYWGHKRFLTAIALHYVLNVGVSDDWKQIAHAWVHGRTYLPQNLRDVARANFKYGPALADEVASIIDEFCGLTFPTGYDRAFELCDRFNQILLPDDQDGLVNYGPGESHDPITQGQPVGEDEQKPDPTQPTAPAPTDDTVTEPDEGDGTGDGEGGGKSEPGTGTEPEGSGIGEGEGEPTSSGNAGEGGESGTPDDDGQNDDPPTPGNRGGSAAGNGPASENFDEVLNELAKELSGLQTDEQSISEAEDFTEDLRRDLFKPKQLEPIRVKYVDVPVGDSFIGIPARVSSHLGRLLDKFRRAWKSNRNSGTINALAYRTRRPGQTNFFDRYQRGQADSTAVEVVVLLDASGSTEAILDIAKSSDFIPPEYLISDPSVPGYGTVIDAISLAGWAVKRSVDSLPNSRCTVFAFGSDNYDHRTITNGLLYGPNERADSGNYRVPAKFKGGRGNVMPWDALGGTSPVHSLAEGTKLFDGTRAENRLLVIVTDGQWDRTRDSHAIIDAYNAAGVTTALFGVGKYDSREPDDPRTLPVSRYGDHHCTYAVDLRTPLELPAKVQTLVERLLSGRLVTGNRR